MTRPTIAYVPLGIEETGALYHLILAEFHKAELDISEPIAPQLRRVRAGLSARGGDASGFMDETTQAAILERMRRLALKLSGTNDRLMGKV